MDRRTRRYIAAASTLGPMPKLSSKRHRERLAAAFICLAAMALAGLSLAKIGVLGRIVSLEPAADNAIIRLPDPLPLPGRARPSMETASNARGLYLTMDTAGSPSNMARIVEYMRAHSSLNALCIDVKDNSGRVPTNPPNGILGEPAGYSHFPGLIQVLHDQGYYMIARIVAFQDPFASEKLPERAIRNSDGSLWRDRDGRFWLNPYDEKNWESVKDIALWAVGMGFDEVQLDYVRFPDSAQGLEKTGSVLMPGASNYSGRSEAIAAFLKYMAGALDEKAYLSADVFGFTTIAVDDMGIGQKLEDVAANVDFISPMVYPSHYYDAGIYGFEVPEAHPHDVVSKAMDQALERTKGLKARIRPWLQDFSMRIHYGSVEVSGQIQAVFEHGIGTYLLWNPANVYTEGVHYDTQDQSMPAPQ